MKESTRKAKETKVLFEKIIGKEELLNQTIAVIEKGKSAFDEYLMKLGKMMAETIMYAEREKLSGPEYQPLNDELKKWAGQPGSIYMAGRKIPVHHPRLRKGNKEENLTTYRALRDKKKFSEEVLAKILRGMSEQKYHETLGEFAGQFGISPTSISSRVKEATAAQLEEFRGRKLTDFKAFAIFLDTIHRGGSAFIVALGIDTGGNKKVLGFWEGASENHEICKHLLSSLELRGLKLNDGVLFITDGGGGVIKALREKFGKRLIHQRCTIHKDRNIQLHLPKKYRNEAHQMFRNALDLTSYDEAKEALKKFEEWLRNINESAADSLMEAFEELLTLHRLKIPPKFRKTLHSTNPIESTFSGVRAVEKNIKRYRDSKMSQRWLGTVLVYAEKNYRRVKGYEFIQDVIEQIKNDHQTQEKEVVAA